MLAQFCYSQDTIKLDFRTKKIVLEEKNYILPGKLYVLHIDNINMNLFNVSLDKKDSVIPTDITFPTLESLGLDGINMVIGNIVSSTSSILNSTSSILNSARAIENLADDSYQQSKFKKTYIASRTNNKGIQVLNKIASTQKQIDSVLEATKPFIKEINVLVSKLNFHALSYFESLDTVPMNPLIKGGFKLLMQKLLLQY